MRMTSISIRCIKSMVMLRALPTVVSEIGLARALTLRILILSILMGSVFTAESHAYLRSTTSEGTEANWFTHCVPLWLNQAGSARIPSIHVERDLLRSLQEWYDVSCADLTLVYEGLTTNTNIGFDPSVSENQNIIVFQSQENAWIHDPRAVGLTTVTMCQNDTPTCAAGTIIDADIELNEVDFILTPSVATNVQMDLPNTLTHELGHFLGLDHSTDPDSTMYAEAPLRETKKRTVDEDDKAGVCELFPLNSDRYCVLASYDLASGAPMMDEGTVNMQSQGSETGCRQREHHSGWLPLLCWLIFLAILSIKRVRVNV